MGDNQQFTKQIFLFLKGKLSPDEEVGLLRRIQKNESEKAHFLNEQGKLRKKMIHFKGSEVESEWKRFQNRVKILEPNQKETSQLNLTLKKLLPLAAAFVLGLVIASTIYFANQQNSTNFHQVQEISIPYGGKSKFTLPDGSEVWLNSGSRLSYPSQFSSKREIQLVGEAFFDVVKSKNPFVVHTNYGEVTVLGTSFNVKAYNDNDFQTTLVRGSVKVGVDDDRNVVIKPGEQAFLDNENQLTVKKVEPEIFIAWKEGKLIFNREPFEKVAKRMERWYNVHIEIDNEEIKDLWFTGTIEMETLSEVMELISKSMPIQYSYDKTSRTLIIGKNKKTK